MMLKDYYEILGVSQKASLDEIRDAYKKLAKAYHPDKHQGDAFFAEKFKSLQEAYAVLSDEDSRKDYDADLATEIKGQGTPKKQTQPKKQSKKTTKNSNDKSTRSKSTRSVNDLPTLVDIYFEQKKATLQTRKAYDTFLASPKKHYSSWLKITIALLVLVLNFVLFNPWWGLLK